VFYFLLRATDLTELRLLRYLLESKSICLGDVTIAELLTGTETVSGSQSLIENKDAAHSEVLYLILLLPEAQKSQQS
ncbi:hypothetical protein, partial [Pseudoalteromonas sp. S4389]|uniref:hypothetical protein n=1 Tax=Pseudoalteromonas sp. S4389 TaxID=579556 RepID=UPI001486BA1F